MSVKAPAKAAEDSLTTSEAAAKMGVDARSLRAFLRSRGKGVGAGSRYEFTPSSLPDLKKSFAAWEKAATEAKKSKQ